MRFPAGTQVQCRMQKWGGRRHWEWAAVYLGADEYGDWVGQPAGTSYSRPGLDLTIASPAVTLIPAGPWQATFYAQESVEQLIQVYVDMATPAVWEGSAVTAVDLDLDVIRAFAGDVVIDDEDEFAEHQVSLGYPPDVIAMAEASCERVHHDVLHEAGPFDLAVSGRWLARLPS